MKKYILILSILSIFSCSSTKEFSKNKINSYFKIITTPILVEKDTIYVNELRFYNIKSARDGMKLMYLNFGKWNKKIESIHQKNMNSFIWENVQLLDENNTLFTVVADGTETETDYFASIKIFDDTQKDCLKKKYPYQEKLIKVLITKMGNLKTKKVDYTIFN
ncbi:hypothetical protein OAB61_00485 [bacterium]|nr:hypothetical protein [bacterium]